MILILMTFSCGKEKAKKSSEAYQSVSGIYSSSALNIKVFYEPGAEPYAENILGNSLWTTLLRPNLEALFDGRTSRPVVSVPGTLAEMTKMPVQNKAAWSIDDVLALAKSNDASAPAGTSTFQIFFVNGFAAESTGIIGFHISGTKIMVIFKDVIESMASPTEPYVARYVEQATIIHEMGHALGLVNNGVKMVTAHQDTTHGAHCVNPDCVMYWSNEGKADMIKFIKKVYTSQSNIMFDSQCLSDSRNF